MWHSCNYSNLKHNLGVYHGDSSRRRRSSSSSSSSSSGTYYMY